MVVRLASGERIAYLAWPGPSDARPVLLLHGLSRTSWSWLPVARRLAGRYPLAAPDLRGHGASDAPREGYDLESLALDMLTVVAAQGWGAAVQGPPVVVAGHGFGAIVAVEAARLEPASISGLVLVDGGWEDVGETSRLSPSELLAAIADPPEVLASMDAYLAIAESSIPGPGTPTRSARREQRSSSDTPGTSRRSSVPRSCVVSSRPSMRTSRSSRWLGSRSR